MKRYGVSGRDNPMEIYNNKRIRCLKHHVGITLRGFVKVLPSPTNTALMAIGVSGFHQVIRHSGYPAVFDFLVATLCSAAALVHVYSMGEDKKVTKR